MPVVKKKITKKKTAKKIKREKKPKETKKAVKFFKGIGRRKTATARVRLFLQGKKEILINEKPLEKYFPIFELQEIVLSPFRKMDYLDKFRVSIKVKGGGFHAQSEAVRNGIVKALVIFDPESRKKFKIAGYLTRDPRMRERKKFGLKRARRAPQWRKR